MPEDPTRPVTGWTASVDFPTSPDALQTSNPGSATVFVAKVNTDGSALAYSTYLGGTGFDEASGIGVDGAGNAYVTGHTNSPDFPTSPGALQASHPGNSAAFVAKLNADGAALAYSTYLGGTGNDAGWGIAVDAAGNTYVIGQTNSSDFPTSPGAVQSSRPGTATAAFVTKVNADGSALAYSTYLGGTGNDWGLAIAIDAAGKAYVAGETRSVEFPTSPGAVQSSRPGTATAAFVTKVNADGSALAYSTYLGGTGNDRGLAIAIDAAGKAYVAGSTSSDDFPTSPGALQTTHPGNAAAFITKLELTNRPPVADAGVSHLVECAGPDGALATLDGSASFRSGRRPAHLRLDGCRRQRGRHHRDGAAHASARRAYLHARRLGRCGHRFRDRDGHG